MGERARVTGPPSAGCRRRGPRGRRASPTRSPASPTGASVTVTGPAGAAPPGAAAQGPAGRLHPGQARGRHAVGAPGARRGLPAGLLRRRRADRRALPDVARRGRRAGGARLAPPDAHRRSRTTCGSGPTTCRRARSCRATRPSGPPRWWRRPSATCSRRRAHHLPTVTRVLGPAGGVPPGPCRATARLSRPVGNLDFATTVPCEGEGSRHRAGKLDGADAGGRPDDPPRVWLLTGIPGLSTYPRNEPPSGCGVPSTPEVP